MDGCWGGIGGGFDALRLKDVMWFDMHSIRSGYIDMRSILYFMLLVILGAVISFD